MELEPISTTEEELTYRAIHFHEVKESKERTVICTCCGNILNTLKGRCYGHVILEILQCKVCWDKLRYILSSSDTNINTLCIICGTADLEVFSCKKLNCPYKVCKRCLKRNTNLILSTIDTDNWNCLICDCKPLWKIRALCSAVLSQIQLRKKSEVYSSSDSENHVQDHESLHNETHIDSKTQKNDNDSNVLNKDEEVIVLSDETSKDSDSNASESTVAKPIQSVDTIVGALNNITKFADKLSSKSAEKVIQETSKLLDKLKAKLNNEEELIEKVRKSTASSKKRSRSIKYSLRKHNTHNISDPNEIANSSTKISFSKKFKDSNKNNNIKEQKLVEKNNIEENVNILTNTNSKDMNEYDQNKTVVEVKDQLEANPIDLEEVAKLTLLCSNSDINTSNESEYEADLINVKKFLNVDNNKFSDNFRKKTSSSDNSEPEISVKRYPKRKRKTRYDLFLKWKLKKNIYYQADVKLRSRCEVVLTRLSQTVLDQHKIAVQKSKEYWENKKLESLTNLKNLEVKNRKKSESESDFSNSSIDDKSSKTKRILRKKEETKSLIKDVKSLENTETEENSDMDQSINDSKLELDLPSVLSVDGLISEINSNAKKNLLETSDSEVINSEEEINVSDSKSSKKDDKEKKTISNSDNDEKTYTCEKSKESNSKRHKSLAMKLSDTDSNEEAEKLKKNNSEKNADGSGNDSEESQKILKRKKKRCKRRIVNSESDNSVGLSNEEKNLECNDKESSNESNDLNKKRKKSSKRIKENSTDSDSSRSEKKPKKKRRRIKKMDSDSDDTDNENCQSGSPNKFGRKNIRKVLKDKQVTDDTKQAAKEEEERIKRIAERQKIYNEMYEQRLATEEKIDKLVLDFDTETKKELVIVDKNIVKNLKPHQAKGIKFMWDACFESLERIKTNKGSGCILAHCMGLGKSLQVVALSHTLLSHEDTGVKTVMVVCPLSTVLNWVHEFKFWLKETENYDDIEIYEMTKLKKNIERMYTLKSWQRTGGVLIIQYALLRILISSNKNVKKSMKEEFLKCVMDPGPDLIVCDEGHLLKKDDTAISKCMQQIKTLRRIVLTGTPLQNNLLEYHCMVQFVKPNLLGTKREFLNRFVNPITNGQFDDSTEYDVKLMKKRAHVLHKMLEGSVQRFDYSVLTPFLPPKQEYVIFLRLTPVQMDLYKHYLDNFARLRQGAGGSLFADFQALQRIWTHPFVLLLNAEKEEKANEKKMLTSDSEGSLKNFINDSDESDSTTSSDSVESTNSVKEDKVCKRNTRNNPVDLELDVIDVEESNKATEWWTQFVTKEHHNDMRISAKLMLLFGILKESEEIGDKVLVFSQSLFSLTLIEEFLNKIDQATQSKENLDTLCGHSGSWSLGLDYFRLDGQTTPECRNEWCKIFNRPSNTRARLFLISTRAGGLGINLTSANRVIIFDASWNPSHDVQSIFRIYRFGQKKPCYVYRFLAAGTMEEKIYNRQVTKLSLSCRVVDEQQIERHYNNRDLNELYHFEPYSDINRPTPILPKDRLLAEIFLKHKDSIENYHEHDSLLENKTDEGLNEEERKQAWQEYEEEKKGRSAYDLLGAQQLNMMNMSQQSNNGHIDLMQNVAQNFMPNIEYFQELLRKDYPGLPPEQLRNVAIMSAMRMHNYFEQQQQSHQNTFNNQTTGSYSGGRLLSNTQQYPVSQPMIHQDSLLTQPSQQQGNELQRNLVQRTTVSNSIVQVADDDIVEIPLENNRSQAAVQSALNINKGEE